MPARVTKKKSRTPGAQARKRRVDELPGDALDDDATGDFFMEDDDIRQASSSDDEEETAEQKRLRVAKQYLDDMRRAEAAEEDEADREGHADALGDRLRRAADLESGAVFRRVADAVGARLGGADVCSGSGRLFRGHRLAVTGVCLLPSAERGFSVGKDGKVIGWDIESGKRTIFPDADPKVLSKADQADSGGGAYWVTAPARRGGSGLLSCAASDDGRLLAVGGASKRVLLYDIRSMTCVAAFPGHKDAITGLAFRPGGLDLFSCSMDRSIKLWSGSALAYVDSLFGHQQEALCIDASRNERLVTGGMDRSVRFWKIPEESQLVFRARSMVTESVAFVTQSQWVSGDQDGCVCLYTNTQKKPTATIRGAHPRNPPEADAPGCADSQCAEWVTSVAAARGTDLVASGAGNGVIRLWRAAGEPGKGGVTGLSPVGAIAARGFVNAIALGVGGRVLFAGIGQEPRTGRWARDKAARNGVLVHVLDEETGGDDKDDDDEEDEE